MDLDLSAFQLVDAMNDIDMLQRQQQQQQQQQQQSQNHCQSSSNNQSDINLIFQTNQSNNSQMDYLYNKQTTTSSPHYRTTPSIPQNDRYDQQEDIFTPLISPAITPSLGYQSGNKSYHNDMDFPQLSSPAILPQHYHRQKRSILHDDTSFDNLSANEIREQYEQLERAKMLITQKLSELQKTQQQDHYLNYYDPSSTSLQSSASSSNISQNQQLMNNYYKDSSKSNSPTQSPHIEPATPASLMNIKVTNSTSKLQFSTNKNKNQKMPDINYIASSNQTATTASPSNKASIPPLPSPLTLQPSMKKLKEKRVKKQRRASSEAIKHASPRALKPLLISPTLNPGLSPTPSTLNSSVPTMEDAEHILATRSNYQNLMEGKGAALGIAFTTQIKSGLEVRRTAHKAAEQKRRDSLKEWFERLRCEVEEGYVKRQKSLMSQVIQAQELEANDEAEESSEQINNIKPLSKVLLLQYAYEYIASLKNTLEEKENTIQSLLKVNNQDHTIENDDTEMDMDQTNEDI